MSEDKKVLKEDSLEKVSGGRNSWDGHKGQEIAAADLMNYVDVYFLIIDVDDVYDPDEGTFKGFNNEGKAVFEHRSPKYTFEVPTSWNRFYLYK